MADKKRKMVSHHTPPIKKRALSPHGMQEPSRHAPPPAFDAVLMTTELLETILHHAEAQDVVVAQRVSRKWRDVIQGSDILLEKIFLIPTHEEPEYEWSWYITDAIDGNPKTAQYVRSDCLKGSNCLNGSGCLNGSDCGNLLEFMSESDSMNEADCLTELDLVRDLRVVGQASGPEVFSPATLNPMLVHTTNPNSVFFYSRMLDFRLPQGMLNNWFHGSWRQMLVILPAAESISVRRKSERTIEIGGEDLTLGELVEKVSEFARRDHKTIDWSEARLSVDLMFSATKLEAESGRIIDVARGEQT